MTRLARRAVTAAFALEPPRSSSRLRATDRLLASLHPKRGGTTPRMIQAELSDPPVVLVPAPHSTSSDFAAPILAQRLVSDLSSVLTDRVLD